MTRQGRGRLIVLGAIAILAYIFLLGPILAIAVASLEGEKSYYFALPPRHLSLTWYWHIPAPYWRALGVSFIVAGVASLVSTILGTAAALGLVRGRVRGKEAIQAIFRLPLQIPFVVTGVVFLQFYYRAQDVGLDLLDSLPGLILAHIFITIPYSVGAVAGVLIRINPRFEEAAQSLGATNWSIFRRITLPLIKPGIFTGLFYGFIVSFGDVPVSLFLTGSHYSTLPVEIFKALQFDFEPSILALSTVVVLFSALLILAMQRLIGLDVVTPAGRS